jgi:hypothetical protein
MVEFFALIFKASIALGLFAVALFLGIWLFDVAIKFLSTVILLGINIVDKILGDKK